MKKRTVALMLACVLIVGCVIGGSLAWLTDQSDEVQNVFTTSDINITLTEDDTDDSKDGEQHEYKMIPGFTIDKRPVVTVLGGSEDCWLFVEVVENCTATDSDGEAYDFDAFLSYNIDLETTDPVHAGWTELKNGENSVIGKNGGKVYFREVEKAPNDQTFNILGSGSWEDEENEDGGGTISYGPNQVLVLPTVTKEMMNKAASAMPTLTFYAYACQLYETNNEKFDASTAWQQTAGYEATTP